MPAPDTGGTPSTVGRLSRACRAFLDRLSPAYRSRHRPPRSPSPLMREVAGTGGCALGCLPIWLVGLVIATLATDACPCSAFYEWLALAALTAGCVAAIATVRLGIRGRREGRVRWRWVCAGAALALAAAIAYVIGVESIPIR